jgi:hypothetical protein
MKIINKRIVGLLSILGVLFCIVAGFVYAANSYPGGATGITTGVNERFNASNYPAESTYAEAGNITEINITAKSQTIYWQGYYGEVTGDVVLDDAQENSMYSWTELEPTGEIYAAINNSISWDEVQCFNHTGSESTVFAVSHNVTYWENIYNMTTTSNVGINETFLNGSLNDGSIHDGFYVGETQIVTGSCPAMDTYERNSTTGDNFQEILLADNSTLIFTTLLENNEFDNITDVVGFDGVTHDFQMIVAEDGRGDNDEVTTYYFWLELS